MDHKSPLMKKVERIIAPTAQSMGYEIVRVLLVGAGGTSRPTLQIMAEKPDGTMDVEDCSRLSQAVSALLDVENVFGDKAYYLELSSPGLDRPLTRLKDFDNYKNNEARVEMDDMIDGQKKFKGMLKGIDGTDVILDTDKGEVKLPFDSIFKAKLLLTDALLKTAAKQQKKGGKANQNRAKKNTSDVDDDNDTASPYADEPNQKRKSKR